MPETILPQPTFAPAPEEITGTKAPEKPKPLKNGTAEQLRQAIRIRELKTQLENNPDIVAQRTLAGKAKTNAGMRAALRNYYTLLYTKIEKIDPSLHDVVEGILFTKLSGLEQHKVRPSKLIEAIPEVPGSHSTDHTPPDSVPTDTAVEDSSSTENTAEKFSKPEFQSPANLNE